ncbi:A24 family peptidase [Sphingomonas oryzagri]|jgi:prepilin peptidase CpaA|uniref:Prepilin peptidase n=1 Tax=Sphingomonas oryzagri TaxID=3042314 RepID=A0ABT6MX77_9SPHN|nr:prepilin peptidase [Sphingomonas oryzagri]MDH7637512.1 prepilin peptidase [Sphingomonas oryzagri]
MQTPLIGILAGGLIAALLYATWTDIRARIIPNPLNAGIALSAPLWWWACGVAPWPGIAIQLAVAAVALLIFMGAFAIGAMGGGDVKLITVLALWLAPLDFMKVIVWMSIGGGILTVAMLVWHKARKIETPLEIPYGVAIALAAIPVLAERYFYQFAA